MSNDNKTAACMLHLLLFIEILIKVIINDGNFFTLFFFTVFWQVHSLRCLWLSKSILILKLKTAHHKRKNILPVTWVLSVKDLFCLLFINEQSEINHCLYMERVCIVFHTADLSFNKESIFVQSVFDSKELKQISCCSNNLQFFKMFLLAFHHVLYIIWYCTKSSVYKQIFHSVCLELEDETQLKLCFGLLNKRKQFGKNNGYLSEVLLLSAIHSAQFSDFSLYFKSVTQCLVFIFCTMRISKGLWWALALSAVLCVQVRHKSVISSVELSFWPQGCGWSWSLPWFWQRLIECLRSNIQQLSAIHLTYCRTNIHYVITWSHTMTKHITGDKALPSLVTHTQTCKFNSESAESAG